MCLFSSKKTVSKAKGLLSENLIFQDLLKECKLLQKSFEIYIQALDEESKRNLVNLISADTLLKMIMYI